jgi:hypothetical protein
LILSGINEGKRPSTALATYNRGMPRPFSTKNLQGSNDREHERPFSVNTANLEYNPAQAKGNSILTVASNRGLSSIPDQSQDGNSKVVRPRTRQDTSIRKNSRLHVMVPADVIMLKGEVLRSAISHHEMYNMKQQNRNKKDMFDMYSLKKKPSIQSVKWRPEHMGLVMSGQTIEPEGSNYGSLLQVPYDKQLQRRNKRNNSDMMASNGSNKGSAAHGQSSRQKEAMRKHRKELENEGVEVKLCNLR